MPRTVHAACPHDCPDACSVLITVDDLGKATKIQGDPDHPATRGFLCGKVAKYLDRVYSPDRVLYPLRRKKNAPKGGGHKNFDDFERITWDSALDEIAAKLASISKEFGSEAILPYSYGGTLGVLGNASMDHRFFHRLGASQLARTICATAGADALVSVLGRKLGTDMEAFRHSKYIIAWGANIHGTNIHLWPFIEEARRNGAKLVVIDPYKTRTAALADWYLPINPGTDVALALAMMHVIINENLYNADYVSKYTLGFDELRKKVQEYPPEKVAGFTGISAADIVKLATDYADIVLPATTFFEQKELVKSYGHYYLQMSHQAIAPLGEARTNVETFRALALRMGFDDPCFKESIEEMMDGALANPTNKYLSGIDRERLERENSVRLNFSHAVTLPQSATPSHVETGHAPSQTGEDAFLPFAHGGFETASGKAELYSESLKRQGLDPVATFIPPSESRHSVKAKQYPLEILTRKSDNHLNSSFCNLPTHQKMEEPRLLEISARDAAVRNIHEGDEVRV